MYTTKSSEPLIDPCRTPLTTLVHDELFYTFDFGYLNSILTILSAYMLQRMLLNYGQAVCGTIFTLLPYLIL